MEGLSHSAPVAPFVLALDVGTSSCRASLYDAAARRIAGVGTQLAYNARVTADGGAELDAEALIELVSQTIDAVVLQSGPLLREVGVVAMSSFWHSLLSVDDRGEAATPVFLWMDARSRDEARQLRDRLDERDVHGRTGCVLHWSYLPAELLWLRNSEPALSGRVRRWLSFGEYLAWRFFGQTWVSVSMASGSGLFNQHRCDWDDLVLSAIPIPRESLSPVSCPFAPFCGLRPDSASRWPGLSDAPWLPAIGDGACSNIGSGCATRERYALIVDTSGALRTLWRVDKVEIPWGAWCYRADRDRVLLGGALNDGGSLFAWLEQALGLPDADKLEQRLAAIQPDSHDLTMLPYWAGERSPNWSDDARGAIVGLRLHTTPVEIVRAALEAVALQFARIEGILRQAVPEAREIIATGGGLLHSPSWLQIMADTLGRRIFASSEAEASSRGAALLALEWLGSLPAALESLPSPVEKVYEPVVGNVERYRLAAERQARLYDQRIAGPPASL